VPARRRKQFITLPLNTRNQNRISSATHRTIQGGPDSCKLKCRQWQTTLVRKQKRHRIRAVAGGWKRLPEVSANITVDSRADTLPVWHRSYVLEYLAQVLSQGESYIRSTKTAIPNQTHLNLIGHSIITPPLQLYTSKHSSATFVSPSFVFRKEKIRRPFHKCYYFICYLFKTANAWECLCRDRYQHLHIITCKQSGWEAHWSFSLAIIRRKTKQGLPVTLIIIIIIINYRAHCISDPCR